MQKWSGYVFRSRKIVFISAMIAILAVHSSAQAEYAELLWVKGIGSADDLNLSGYRDQGSGVAVDGNDNVYITGRFSGTIDLDPSEEGIDTHTADSLSTYLVKFNADGNYVWGITLNDQPGEIEPEAIVVDHAGYPIIVGRCSGTVDFDAGGGEHIVTTGINNFGFLLKYTPGGVFDWAMTWDLNANWIYDVAVSNSGDIYVTGDFYFSVDFITGSNKVPDAREEIHTATGGADVFITKVDSQSNYRWTRTFGGPGRDVGSGLAVSPSGVAVAGIYEETVDFNAGNPGQDLHTSEGGRDIFIAKYGVYGDFLWARTVGSATSNEDINDVTVDSSQNVIGTGYFCETMNFNGSGGNDWLSPHESGCDAFLTKYNASGAYLWSTAHGDGEGSTEHENGYRLISDAEDNILFTGVMDNVSLSHNILVAKYTGNNIFRWYFMAGKNRYNFSAGRDIALDSAGNFYITGDYFDTAYFDPSGKDTSLTAKNESDIFLAKYTVRENEPSAFWDMMLPAIISNREKK